MADSKKSTNEKIENNLACVAFADEGEPCPLNGNQEAGAVGTKNGEESVLQSIEKSVETDLACTAFHDENETCPICKDKKKK